MSRGRMNPALTKGVAKVPVIMQLEVLECGAACLAMIMAYYGKWIPLEQVRLACGVSRDGSNAKNIYLAARNYGMEVKAFRMEPEGLKNKATYPCIIHWNMDHFVVLKGFKGNRAYINDPARGSVAVSWEELDESFSGMWMIPVPSESFEQEGSKRSIISLAGAAAAAAFVMITTAIMYLFGIANSMTSRIFMDRLLTGSISEWLYPFIWIMVLIALIQLTTEWIRSVYSLKINGKMAAIGSSSYMWKLMRLPMEFFSQRLAGDIQSRLFLNESIAGAIVDTFAPLLFNSVMMIVYLVLMIRQSIVLAVVGLAAVIINVIVSKMITEKRMNITRVQMRDEGMLEAATVTGISMIETIKSSGAESGFFAKWAGHHAAVNRQNVDLAKTDLMGGMLAAFFADAANYAVLLIGVYMTMQGKYTLGGVFMFQGFLTAFMSPVSRLIRAGQTLQQMRIRMERIEDVMEYPDDVALAMHPEDESIEVDKLEGNVELKNITFGYSRLSEPLISDFSLTMKTGDRVAIVGASGCGKSTLSKLISGLYQPWEGEILFDGKPRSAYPRDVITGSIAVVDQDIILFEDTIAENIRMWDSSIKDFEIIMAARDAQLHDDIVQMPGGYHHKLTSGGRELSGGQRQRLEIARVLAQDPMIIILDEATSALDARTEYDVVRSIRDRGITCIVIAHRLSTVRDCDEIIVLDHGKVAERGTHEELMALNGAYAELVMSE